MGDDGLTVDVQALTDAGEGITEVLSLLDEHPVEDIDCDTSAAGHDELAERLASFCTRWQLGVEHLLEDGRRLSRMLLASAAAYRQYEDGVHEAISGGEPDR